MNCFKCYILYSTISRGALEQKKYVLLALRSLWEEEEEEIITHLSIVAWNNF